MSSQDKATICKSNPTRINSIITNAAECANETEHQRRQTFATDTGKQKDDIENLKSVYTNALASADSIFGSGSTTTFATEIDTRNKELKQKVAELTTKINRSKASIERADRDFVDSKEQQPETVPIRTAHVIDDYTLIIMFISYLFLALTILYWYVQQNDFSTKALLTGIAVGIVVSGILAMLLWAYL
jgi:hypothetical protein